MNKKVEASALARWMDKGKGIKEPPGRAQAGHNLEQPEHAPARPRKKSERTARIEVRVTPAAQMPSLCSSRSNAMPFLRTVLMSAISVARRVIVRGVRAS